MSCLIIMSQKELHRLEVVQKIRERRLSVVQAAELLGLSRSQVHRLLQAYDRAGADGLVSKKRGRPSNRRHSEDFRNLVLDLVREHYGDFGPTLAAERLIERHRIAVSKETLRQWMTQAGLWTSRCERKRRLHQPRGRRDCFGEPRSTARIISGSRTAVPNAPCLSISTMPPASCCTCALPPRRTPSTICGRRRPICSSGASRSPFTATSMASSAPPMLLRRTEPAV